MRFDIVTIFPNVFSGYFGESIIKRAQQKGIVTIATHDLRDFSRDKHHKVDDTPYGGGAGMVLAIQPIYDCVQTILSNAKKVKRRIILLSAKGKRFAQKDAQRLARYDHVVLICGRYEGVDERVAEHIADEELSIGDYVLTGGEVPAMVVVDAVTRLLPGALGNEESPLHESHSRANYREHPHYTKPASFRSWQVPSVLLSGDHKKIAAWRAKHARRTR